MKGQKRMSETIKVTRRVFNLDTCAVSKKESEVPFTDIKTLQEGLERSDNKEDKLIGYVNIGLKREAKIAGRAQIVLADNEVPLGAVNGFVKSFLPMFSSLKKKNAKGEEVDDTAAQKQAAVKLIRGNEQIFAAFKAYVISKQAEEDEEESDEE